jgi:hypothetical protein
MASRLGQRFQDDFGLSIYDADAETIVAFTKIVSEESEPPDA